MVARKYVSLNIEYPPLPRAFLKILKMTHESNWASNASDQSYYDNDFVTAESGALETRRWKNERNGQHFIISRFSLSIYMYWKSAW